jgi:hypothetical protein
MLFVSAVLVVISITLLFSSLFLVDSSKVIDTSLLPLMMTSVVPILMMSPTVVLFIFFELDADSTDCCR